jgi:hypothetical protein
MITMCYCFRFHFLIFSQSGDLVWPCRGFYHLCQVSSLFIPIVFAWLLLAEWMDGGGGVVAANCYSGIALSCRFGCSLA